MNHNNNQYGLSGFLKAIRSNDPLVLGQDLNKMGLDFTSKKKYLHKSFTGPWTQRNEPAVSVVDLSTEVPAEYKNVSLARNKLPELKMGNMGEDVLFYLFYNCPGDVYQIAAATELIKRSWRFHKVKKVWLLSPLPLDAQAASSSGDLGECLCYLFDPIRWRKETQTINLRADELEMSLHLSSAVNAQKSLPVASSRSQQPNIGNAAFTLSSVSTSAYATNEAINSSAFAASEENPTLVRASTSASTTTPERSSQDDTMAANGSLSAVERALNQLKRIALGVSIPKQEMRFLLDFLNENPEVFGKMDSGNQFLNFIQYEPEVAGVLLVFQLMYDPGSYYSNLEILLNMHMNAQILIAVNKFVQLCEFKSLQVPSDFLNKFISLCISICERDSSQDMAADRLVRMVCVFFSALLGLRHFDPTMMRSEIQNFATSYLSLREASQLYQKTLLL